MTRRSAAARTRPIAALILGLYAIGVALVVFWPQHADRGAGPLLHAIAELFPWATHSRIEFASNVLMFVPLGLLLTLLLARRPYLAVLICFAGAMLVETVQGTLLPGRTASGMDVVANTLGAVIGTVVGMLILRRPAVRAT